MALLSRAPGNRRWFQSSCFTRHENPLGLPRSHEPPQIPRRAPNEKRPIPHVRHVVAVASGKGGVGKSTVSVNLAFALAAARPRSKIGLLDLDIFGPSIPKLMGLESIGEPELTEGGALIPLTNYNIPCMSMGFLLPPSATRDAPVVWRGLMVQKAAQQLLFDVDWRRRTGQSNDENNQTGLDVLVVDMPPGTGDVQLTLGQLVKVDGAVIVSTPQDVALLDARKGVHMFRKVGIPILGLVINSAYYRCISCSEKHYIFGTLNSAKQVVIDLELNKEPVSKGILGEIPLVAGVSQLGDQGKLGELFLGNVLGPEKQDLREVGQVMQDVAKKVWETLSTNDIKSRS